MTSQQRAWPDAVAAVLLLVATGLACFALGVVWVADFDGDDEAASVAGVSAVVLATGIVVAVVAGVLGRRWRSTWVVLLVTLVVAAVPLLSLA